MLGLAPIAGTPVSAAALGPKAVVVRLQGVVPEEAVELSGVVTVVMLRLQGTVPPLAV